MTGTRHAANFVPAVGSKTSKLRDAQPLQGECRAVQGPCGRGAIKPRIAESASVPRDTPS
ncbi:Protein of unknown function [Gryllus bimaculatus]|nr:Protein of unknown function [Gryllus bimaculatus]